ncbi:SufB/SufD family protein [Spiroplasma taiwanense]|uniref:FeS assembly protein SufD n=1 Tax=Spiroplasma taiwanense CT-1 TaxID=1276220 RepID=S5MCP8_9MOLU|nr:SufD family Fe-S cluster assembly protein [Spiroplasma taiwanense]AGR41493.1 FeS assembly protein SufD [Spiroplasma taiwanense CT-1]
MLEIALSPAYLDFRNELPSSYTFSKNETKILLLEKAQGSIEFDINNNTELNLVILFLPSIDNSKKIFNLDFNLNKNSNLNLKIANLNNFNCDDNISINLNGENSLIDYYSSTIINKNFNKNSVIKSIHNSRNSSSNIQAYEVLKDISKGFIRCISDIRQGSSSSEAHQELRLLVLDKEAKADSDPVLLIDENDIVASHANAIGMLDPDQIFYLLSRGLNKIEAQELIINGYFEPVFQLIENEDLLNYLKKTLKEMI